MISTPNATLPIHYSSSTIQRAERAVRCAPFQLDLYTVMSQQSVDLRAIAGKTGMHQGYTRRPVPELSVENQLLWLIQVGLLRREVDGQGITNSFRLTPLGHQVIKKWQQRGRLPAASLSDRLYNALNRWARLPSWLR